MNRKLDDLLARFAFDELDEESKSKIDRLVDQDSSIAKRVDEYRAIRQDLKGLAHVPEHQLSNDRLRDAILGQGLKPAGARQTDFGWIWSTAAACAVVTLAMFGLKALRHQDPEIVMPTGGIKLGSDVALNSVHDLHLSNSAGVGAHFVTVKQPVASHPALHLAESRHHRRKLADSNIDPDLRELQANMPENESGTPTVKDANTAVIKPAVLKPVDSEPSSGGVVLIEQNPDKDTGALSAREVESSSYGSIGG